MGFSLNHGLALYDHRIWGLVLPDGAPAELAASARMHHHVLASDDRDGVTSTCLLRLTECNHS